MDRVLRLPLYGAIGLLIYMPFHVFLSQWLSTFTGGLDYWKIGKDVFLLLALALAYGLLIYKRRFEDRYFWILTLGALAYFATHFLVWAANPGIDKEAALLGTAYNCRIFGYALLAWAALLLQQSRDRAADNRLQIRKFFKIALAASAAVALIGLVQFALPKDVMSHFGYSLERGVKPAFFIDDKGDLPRVMSTIRDPNSLGAYLILPIVALALAWFRFVRARMLIGGLVLLNVWALFLTFSRSAWLGTVLAVVLAVAWQYKTKFARLVKKYKWFLLAGVIILSLGVFAARDQYFVQNVVFHADESTTLEDPNELRMDFYEQTSESVLDRPLGHGPGTAGLVSIQTDNVVLTENYFLQIAYEVGIQGLILLSALMGFVLALIYKRRDVYSKILLASFAGITVSAMLLHTWTNEAVAAQWWLLAGFVLGAGALATKSGGFSGAGNDKANRQSRSH